MNPLERRLFLRTALACGAKDEKAKVTPGRLMLREPFGALLPKFALGDQRYLLTPAPAKKP